MKALAAGRPGVARRAAPARPEPRKHPLFEAYPLDGQAHLSTGTVPTPYHVYDGHGLFIGGTADLAAARELLAPEQVSVVQTEAGHALMAVWVCNFTDASLGPHHELQFSIFVSDQPVAPVAAHRSSLIELMLTRPDVRMLCHGLWNNTPDVVAYNRELLALDARPARSRIERAAGEIGFDFVDAASDTPLLQGRIRWPQRASLRANAGLMWRLGLWRLLEVARRPWLHMQIVNPVGEALGRNAVADSYTRTERSLVRHFDPEHDSLVFGDTRYRHLQFRPDFCQSMDGFKFVYLFPR
jgi:hypothetical protein